MDRLTHRHPNGEYEALCCLMTLECDAPGKTCAGLAAITDRLGEYEDTGFTPAECAELAKAKDEGRVMPCKVVDVVYRLCGAKGRRNKHVAERTVRAVTICGNGDSILLLTTTEDWLGKTVFLTREAAEAALAGRTEDAKC